MNDLISREQLINKLNSTGTNITFDIPVEEILGENVDLDNFAALMQDAIQAYRKMVIDTIKNMPTAYDVDKVVKQLEELRKECEDPLQDYDPNYFIDKAIEITKGGGVDGN